MENNFNTPKEILSLTISGARGKVNETATQKIFNGILGGIYVAIASYGFVFAKAGFANDPALGSFIGSILFPTALMLVVVCGGELFTGNALMFALGLDEKGNWGGILINWLSVYIGNIIGSVLIAAFAVGAGKIVSNSVYYTTVMNIANGKLSHTFAEAFSLGVLCNILVAGAVWMSTASKDVTGKIFSCFFPVMLFVFSGFEHSVANMYYLSSAFFASSGAITVSDIFLKNLLPVSLGNAFGGGILIAAIYWIIHSDKKKEEIEIDFTIEEEVDDNINDDIKDDTDEL